MRSLRFAILFVAACSVPEENFRHITDGHPGDGPADAMPDGPGSVPMLTAAPTADVMLGDVIVGQASAKSSITVSNNGDQTSGAITIAFDDTTLGLALTDDMCSGQPLAGHHTCTFAVQFTPPQSGTANTMLRIDAAPGGAMSKVVSGRGLTQGMVDVVEASYDFSSVGIDTGPVTKTFTIRNTGQTTIGAPVPTTANGDASYAIQSHTCTVPLAQTGTCTVVVAFDPATVGMKAGSLTVTSTGGGGMDSATLAGIGTAHVAVTLAGTGTGLVTSTQVGINCGTQCAADFSSSPVTLTALASLGSTFGGWSGDCTGMGSCSLPLDGGKTVTATFTVNVYNLTIVQNGTGTGSLATSLSPAGAVGMSCGTGCTAYPYQTMVTLTPTAATGSVFSGWSGDCAGTTTCSVTMDHARNVVATFARQQFPLTVINAGTGTGNVASNMPGVNGGIDCGTSCNDTYDYNAMVVLTATPATGTNPAVAWAGCLSSTATTCNVTMTAAHSVTATFTAGSYVLTITPPANGSVTTADGNINCAGTCSKSYAYQAAIVLTAAPATGYHFDHWVGGPCNTSTTATCVFAGGMPAANTTTQALFAIDSELLTVNVGGTGTGVVTSNPGTIMCPGSACTQSFNYNTPITLTAAPQSGAVVTWTGCTPGAGNTCTLTITQPTTVGVTFSTGPQTLTVHIAGNAAGTVTGNVAPLINCPGACTQTYAFNQTVVLTATAGGGASFTGWSGDCSGPGTCTVVMSALRDVTANFFGGNQTLTLAKAGNGTGTLSVNPSQTAISCNADASVCVYPFGTTIQVAQTPAANSMFGGWAGACTGASACTLTMDQPRNVTATFSLLRERLQLQITGGGTVTPSPLGTPCPSPAVRCWDYDYGSPITLNPAADSGSSFSSWSPVCAGSTAPCMFNITSNLTETATFVPNVTLAVTINGDGVGTVTSNIGGISCFSGSAIGCSADFPSTPVQQVTLTAAQGSASIFTGWSGGGCGTAPSCVVTMNQAQSVTATFLHVYKMTAGSMGNGSVTQTVGSGTQVGGCGTNCFSYTSGTRVQLTANAGTSAYFSDWGTTGPCVGSGNPCTVAMTGDFSVTANFGIQYQLTISKTGSGTVTSSDSLINCGAACSASFPAGSMVMLTASPSSDSVFATWTGCTSSTGNQCTVTMDQAKTVSVAFYYDLDIGISAGSGTVAFGTTGGITCSPASGYSGCQGFAPTTSVAVTATPATGYHFTGWGGACSGTGTCNVTLAAAKFVTAAFAVNTYTVTVSMTSLNAGPNTITGLTCSGTSCTGTFAYNATVSLVASPEVNNGRFTGWTGLPPSCTGNNGTCSFVMPGNALTGTAGFDWFATMKILANRGFPPSLGPVSSQATSTGAAILNCTNTTTLAGTCSVHLNRNQALTITFKGNPLGASDTWTSCESDPQSAFFVSGSGSCAPSPTNPATCSFTASVPGVFTSEVDTACCPPGSPCPF
ncbi:MAG: Flagellar hook-length control protein FliK [Myxococcales bacterium]|nr:Flagellar hook-length control protein FliK [Myxococcales bacterium]